MKFPQNGTVTAKELNVRSGPGTTFPIVGKLKAAESVSIAAESSGWYLIGIDQWVSAKFVHLPNGHIQDPLWIQIAKKEIGQKEVVGSAGHNPRILEYHKATAGASTDEVPWCSSFATWVMKQAGFPCKGQTAQARTFIKFGKKIAEPVYGCIVVFAYDSVKGHVGFVVGKSGDRIQVLGGNQGDSVKVSNFGTSQVLGYVIPEDYVPQIPLTKLVVSANGDIESTR